MLRQNPHPQHAGAAGRPRHRHAFGPISVPAALAQPGVSSPLNERPPESAALEADPGERSPPSIQSSLGSFGDPGGFRAMLARRGILSNILYTNEVLGNVSGGIRRGPIYAGKLETAFTVDLDKLAGWTGMSGFANIFQIHDTGGLRDRSFQRLITVSNIEAFPATRLSELWLERRWDDNRFGLRFGQLTADGEFFSSDTGKLLFLSNDWPTITGANLPSGGPAYPLATPGVRFRWDPDASRSALLAVFNGDPGDQRLVNTTGTNFRLNDPPLVMGEVQVRRGQEQQPNGLSGSVKLGFYRHFGRFDDLTLRCRRPPPSKPREQRNRQTPARYRRPLRRRRPADLSARGRDRRTRRLDLHPLVVEPLGPEPDRSLGRWRSRRLGSRSRPPQRHVRRQFHLCQDQQAAHADRTAISYWPRRASSLSAVRKRRSR